MELYYGDSDWLSPCLHMFYTWKNQYYENYDTILIKSKRSTQFIINNMSFIIKEHQT